MVERGLDMSGIVNTPLAIGLWTVGGLLLIYGAYLVVWPIVRRRSKLSQESADSLVQQQGLIIQISKAFRSGEKTVRGAEGERASHFKVDIELTLRVIKPSIHLSWVRLCMAGKQFDPIQSTPALKDSIEHTEESYEVKFEIPVQTFLKARYPAGATEPTSEPEAQIYVKAGGADWYSETFAISVHPIRPS